MNQYEGLSIAIESIVLLILLTGTFDKSPLINKATPILSSHCINEQTNLTSRKYYQS